MKTILLILLGFSTLTWSAFHRDTNNVVVDEVTGLEWQDDAQVGNNVNNFSWQDAIDQCEVLNIGGHDDWRLPNINELMSIANYYTSTPSIDATFQNTLSDAYWSSTGYTFDHQEAWYLDFSEGFTYKHVKGTLKYVRCVRN